VRFHLQVDATFEAADIDHALVVITEHLTAPWGLPLCDGWLGNITIEPLVVVEP
jgi:hypothetical protein